MLPLLPLWKKILTPMLKPIGIIIGTGDIPQLLIQACQRSGRAFVLIAYEGYTDPDLIEKHLPHCWLRLGQVGKTLEVLKEHGARDIVLAGGGRLSRPSFRHLSLDQEGRRLLARLGFRWKGDNTILKTISDYLEEKGFCIKSPQDFLPPLVSPSGVLGIHRPSPEALQDIAVGGGLLASLSPFDFGQGVAVQEGLILGIEAAEGTDACIRRCGLLKREGSLPPVYIKRAKIGQDQRLDLPVVGPETLKALTEAGFGGIAFQAEQTLLISLETLREKADAAGLFLWAEA
jgi:DUF1009 family protein